MAISRDGDHGAEPNPLTDGHADGHNCQPRALRSRDPRLPAERHLKPGEVVRMHRLGPPAGIAAPWTRCACRGRFVSMISLLRLALQVVLFFILLSLVVAVASAQTGTVEKIALIASGALFVWLASRVRRIGAPLHRT